MASKNDLRKNAEINIMENEVAVGADRPNDVKSRSPLFAAAAGPASEARMLR
jgi:hypothetical protein